jgi:hypothetical protein
MSKCLIGGWAAAGHIACTAGTFSSSGSISCACTWSALPLAAPMYVLIVPWSYVLWNLRDSVPAGLVQRQRGVNVHDMPARQYQRRERGHVCVQCWLPPERQRRQPRVHRYAPTLGGGEDLAPVDADKAAP